MKLWKHQEYAVKKFKDRPFFGLLFDCGLGKTVTAIKIAEAKDRPVLIIAPNVLCRQWKEEIEKYQEEPWETVVCTSKTKHTKKFRGDFEKLCEDVSC